MGCFPLNIDFFPNRLSSLLELNLELDAVACSLITTPGWALAGATTTAITALVVVVTVAA